MTPWYKERWPWILMSGPATVIVAGIVTMWSALATADTLVVDDYYLRGITINDRRRPRSGTLPQAGDDPRQERAMKTAILILWPSFIVGGIGEGLFFTVFDPKELYLFGEPSSLSRLAVYSIGFFLCWAFAAASSALTVFLGRS